ncbi:hypothetical protein MNV49_007117 [Pseudohyphozyma bogoriensis]|nr:hypothetical protein MNV49_007117 [Pseudohyphozyma bogoriensis]
MQSNNPYKSAPPTTSNSTNGQPYPEPDEPPPAYSRTGAGAGADGGGPGPSSSSHLAVPSVGRASSEYTSEEDGEDNVIPKSDRRSMEEESRELPEGWVREWDPNSKHIFYVDTRATPPRSSWVHPYDDPQYLNSLPESAPARQHTSAFSPADDGKKPKKDVPTGQAALGGGEEKKSFGRKLKDKVTGTTHEQRVKERQLRAEQEKKQYEAYLQRRQAIIEAQRSGRYQPRYAAPMGGYSNGLGYGGGYGYGYPGNMGYGYGGRSAYGGYGYGRGGMGGGGLALGAGAGLLGGLLLGDMMF